MHDGNFAQSGCQREQATNDTRSNMRPPELILLSGSNAREILGSYNQAIAQLAPDIREQFAALMKHYLSTLDWDSIGERLNGRTVAQVLAEIPSDKMNSLVASRFIWNGVRTIALSGTADAVKTLSCPKCGGTLRMSFDPASPQPDNTISGCLMVNCDECTSGCCADRLSETPPWVASLGPTVKTEAPR